MYSKILIVGIIQAFVQLSYSQCINRCLPSCGNSNLLSLASPNLINLGAPNLLNLAPNLISVGQPGCVDTIIPPTLAPAYLPQIQSPTTIIQDSSVSNNLANALQLLVVSNLLSNTLPTQDICLGPSIDVLGNNLLPFAPALSPCGCGCNNRYPYLY